MDEPAFSGCLSLEYSPGNFMRIKRILSGGSAAVALRVLFTLALAAPITCQNEAEPYFSLSSNRTFASSDRPEVMLSGWQVPAVWSLDILSGCREDYLFVTTVRLQRRSGFGSLVPLLAQ